MEPAGVIRNSARQTWTMEDVLIHKVQPLVGRSVVFVSRPLVYMVHLLNLCCNLRMTTTVDILTLYCRWSQHVSSRRNYTLPCQDDPYRHFRDTRNVWERESTIIG